MSDLQDLIIRLEEAEGPDWKLSQDIGEAVGAGPRHQHPGSQEPVHLNYTASLDAAVSLVPEGWEWKCEFGRFVPHIAIISSSKIAYGCFAGECDSNRAIALCIAALKARLAND